MPLQALLRYEALTWREAGPCHCRLPSAHSGYRQAREPGAGIGRDSAIAEGSSPRTKHTTTYCRPSRGESVRTCGRAEALSRTQRTLARVVSGIRASQFAKQARALDTLDLRFKVQRQCLPTGLAPFEGFPDKSITPVPKVLGVDDPLAQVLPAGLAEERLSRV